MATLVDDKDKLLQGTEGQQGLGGAQGGPPSLGGSGESAFAGGAGGGGGVAAPKGSGGQAGQWTNIQAYLNANKGNTSSSKLVEDVGSKIGAEKSAFNSQASEAKSKADAEAEKTNVGQDQASKLIEDASKQQRGSDPYNAATGQLKSAVNATYEGPQDFTYARDAKNMEAGQQLGDDQQFGGLMENLYRGAVNKTGNTMGRGALSLQKQLDLDPEAAAAIGAQRSKALENYAGLNADYETLVPQTSQAVKAAQGRFGSQQKSLVDFLTGAEGQNLSEIDGAVQKHNDLQTQHMQGNQDWKRELSDGFSDYNQLYDAWDYAENFDATEGNFMDWANSSRDVDQGPGGYSSDGGPTRYQTALWSANSREADADQRARSNAFLKLYGMLNNRPIYDEGEKADKRTVGGVDSQRNKYNSILDVLGKQDFIDDEEDARQSTFQRRNVDTTRLIRD